MSMTVRLQIILNFFQIEGELHFCPFVNFDLRFFLVFDRLRGQVTAQKEGGGAPSWPIKAQIDVLFSPWLH